MTLEIKLDSNALEALFAEPDAKVKLQPAAIEEAIAREVAGLDKYIEDMVHRLVRMQIDSMSTKLITEQIEKKMSSVRNMMDNLVKMA